MKVTLYMDGSQSEFSGIDVVDQVGDIVKLDGVMHTGVNDVKVEA